MPPHSSSYVILKEDIIDFDSFSKNYVFLQKIKLTFSILFAIIIKFVFKLVALKIHVHMRVRVY